MELFDTAFIVLRKQNLIFLHWYHHITVMWISFFSYIDLSSSCRLFMVMNYSVHSIMYTYYTLRAMRIRVPKVFAVITTSLQIIQMIFGLLITLTVLHYKQTGKQNYHIINTLCPKKCPPFVETGWKMWTPCTSSDHFYQVLVALSVMNKINSVSLFMQAISCCLQGKVNVFLNT